MNSSVSELRCRAGRRRALTLVEAVVSIAIVGITLVAALNTVGASGLARRATGDRSRARLLAQQLMSEIMRQAYQDPEGGTGMRLDAGELASPRSNFDDVDDYHRWSASPPEDVDGNPIPEATGWGRSVTVSYANPLDLKATVLLDLGVKKITVQVTRNKVVVASLTAVRTGGADLVTVGGDAQKELIEPSGVDPPKL
jgi:type II secretory pathway pseudopilin PulG